MKDSNNKKKKIIILSTLFSLLGIGGLATGLSFVSWKKKSIPNNPENPQVQPDPGKNPGEVDPTPPTPPVNPEPGEPEPKPEDPDNDITQERNVSKNFIKKQDKVKYLALGDSISAGFSGELDKDYAGEFKDGKVSGTSFPAYVAHLINKLQDGKLESFHNFASSGSTIVDWMELFNIEYKKSKTEEKYFDTGKTNMLEPLIQKFGSKEKAKEEIEKQIKNANLISLTLGANDVIKLLVSLLTEFDFAKYLNDYLNGNQINFAELGTKFLDLIGVVRNVLESRLEAFGKWIKAVNPNANIVFGSYPMPMQRLLLMVNELLPNFSPNLNINFLFNNIMIQKIQDAVARKAGLNFVNLYDDNFWSEHQEKLTNMIFDIHPSTYGYKKMAAEFLMKISAGKTFTYATAKKYGFSKEHFVEKDETKKDISNYIMELPDKDADVTYKKLFGDDFLKYLYGEDELRTPLKDKFSEDNFGKRMNDDSVLGLFVGLKSTIVTIFESQKYKEIDPEGHLSKFFTKDNGKNAALLVDWLKGSGYLAKILNKAQKLLTTKDWDNDGKPGAKKLKPEYLKQAFGEIFTINELFNFIKEMLASDFATQGHNDFSDALSNFLGSLVKNPKVEELLTFAIEKYLPASVSEYISKKDLKTLLLKTIKSNETPKILKSLIDAFLSLKNQKPDEFKQISNFQDLLKLVFANFDNFPELTTNLKALILELLRDNEVKPVLVRTVQDIVTKKYPEFIKDIENDKFKQLVMGLINLSPTIIEKIDLFPTLFQTFFQELANNGLNFNLNTFTSKLLTKIKEKLHQLDLGQSILEVGKAIANSQELKESAPTFKKLGSNVLNLTISKFDAKNKLIEVLKQNASKFLTEEEIKLLADITFKSENIDTLIDYLTNLTVNNTDIYNNANSFENLVNKLFDKSNNASVNKFLEKLSKQILSYEETQKLLLSLAKKYNLNKDIQDEEFKALITNLFDFIFEQDNNYDLLSTLVKTSLTSLVQDKFTKFDFSKLQEALKIKFANLTQVEEQIKLVKNVLTNDKLRNKPEVLSKFISNIYDFVLSQESLKQQITNGIGSISYDKVKEYISKDNFDKVVNLLLNNQDLKSILQKAIKDILSLEKSKIEAINNYNDLIKLLFSDVNIQNELKDFVKKFTLDLIKNPVAQEVIFEILYAQGQKINLFNNVTKDNAKLAFGALFNKIETLNNKLGIYSVVFDALMKQLKTNGISINFEEVQKEIFASLKTKFADFNAIKQTSFDLLQLLVNNPALASQADTIKTILNNGLDFAITQFELKTKSFDMLKPKLLNYLEESQISNLNEILFKKDLRETLISYLADVLIKRGNKYASATNLKDLVEKILNDSENDFNTLLNNLFSKVTKYDETKSIVKALLTKQGLITNLSDEEINKLTEALVSFVFEFDKKEQIINPSLKKILLGYLEQGTNFDVKNALTELLNSFKEKFNKEEKIVDFTKFVLTNDSLKQNVQAITKFTSNLYDKYLSQGDIKTKIKALINEKVLPLAQGYVDQNQLEKLTEILLQENKVKDLLVKALELSIASFTKEELKDVKTYSDLIKTTLGKNNIQTELSTKVNELFQALLAKDEVKEILVNVIYKTLKEKYADVLSSTDETKVKTLLKAFLKDFHQLENKLQVVSLLTSATMKNISKNGVAFNFNEFKNELVNGLQTKFANKEFTKDFILSTFKLVAKDNELQTEKDTLKTILTNVTKMMITKFDVEDVVIQKLKGIASSYLEDEQITKLVKAILEENNYKELIDFVLKALITNASQYENVNTLQELISKVFEHNNIYELIEKIVSNLTNKQEIKDIIVALMKKFKLDTDITEDKLAPLATNLVLGIVEFDKDPDNNFLAKFLKSVLNSFVENGKDIDFTSAIQELITNVKSKVSSIEDGIKLLKVLTSKPHMKQTADELPTLIKNIIVLLNEKLNFASKVYGKLPEVVKEYLSEDNLKTILSKLVSEPNLYAIVDPLIKDLLEHNEYYVSAKNIQDLLKIFLEKNTTFNLNDKIKTLIKTICEYDEVGETVSSAIIKFIKGYGFDFDDEQNKKLFKDLTKDVPNVLNIFGITDKVVDTVKNSINSLDAFSEMITKIKGLLPNLFDYKDYKKIIQLLGIDAIKNNKDTVKADLTKVANTLKSKPDTIDKLIEKFHLADKFNHIPSAKEEMSKLLKAITSSDHIEKVLLAFFDELINKNGEYLSKDLWSQALHKFFNSNLGKQAIPNAMKHIVPKALSESKFLGLMLGYQLPDSFSSMGIGAEPITNIKPYFATLIDSFLKGITKTDLIDVISTNIFDAIKSLDPKQKNLEAYLSDLKVSAIEGAIKFIADGQTIKLDKLLSGLKENDRIQKIFDEVNPEAFARVINFMFRYTHIHDFQGVYKILFQTAKHKAEIEKHIEELKKLDEENKAWKMRSTSLSNNILDLARQVQNPVSTPAEKKLEIKFEMGDILSLVTGLNNIKSIIQALFTPLSKAYWETISNNKFTDLKQVKMTYSYQAFVRMQAFIFQIAMFNIDQNVNFGASFAISAAVNSLFSAIEDSLNSALSNELKEKIKANYDSSLFRTIGINNGNNLTANKYFFSGIKGTRNSSYNNWSHNKYESDWWGYYMYYPNLTGSKNPKYSDGAQISNIVMIAKLFKEGYLD